MHYFGIPTCPYCKKRVNIIRTWSLKRQGEYQCPRCGGISNIFLSPLIHVFAILAIFSGGALYFFHKFILDDVTLKTAVQILIPFAVFYLISLFMVYLVKPVIKKVSRTENVRKNRNARTVEDRRRPQPSSSSQLMYDSDEYIPQREYNTGTVNYHNDNDVKIMQSTPRRAEYTDEMQKTSVISVPTRPAVAPQPTVPIATPVSQQRPAQRPIRVSQPVRTVENTSQPNVRQKAVVQPAAVVKTEPVNPRITVGKAISNDDFFAKYDDPEYVERRLREIKEQKGE